MTLQAIPMRRRQKEREMLQLRFECSRIAKINGNGSTHQPIDRPTTQQAATDTDLRRTSVLCSIVCACASNQSGWSSLCHCLAMLCGTTALTLKSLPVFFNLEVKYLIFVYFEVKCWTFLFLFNISYFEVKYPHARE